MNYLKVDLCCSRKSLKQINLCLSRLKCFDIDRSGIKLVNNIEQIRNINKILVYWWNVRRGTVTRQIAYDHVNLMLSITDNDNYIGYQYSIYDIDCSVDAIGYKNYSENEIKNEMLKF